MKKLSELLNNVKIKQKINFSDVWICSLAHNSKKAKEGTLFFCLEGSLDGHEYAENAVSNGAIALVVSHKIDLNIPQIVVEDTRAAISIISANFYDNPANKLKIVGIVGTNGKTTSTYMLRSILKTAKIKHGLIGTTAVFIDDEEIKAELTTPDPIFLHELFSKMLSRGCEVVVMEVSAHAIALKKLNGIMFDVLIFTNATHDHLDFFKTLENYYNTKKSIFNSRHAKSCVINVDDEVGMQILKETNIKEVITYGIKNPADCFAIDIKSSLDGSNFFVNISDNIFETGFCLAGIYNVYNALGVICASKILKLKIKTIADGLYALPEVAGRFNLIKTNFNFNVVIDYAHTPDGMEKALSAIRKHCKNRLICVFGATGNRDKLKRPILGKIASEFSDFIVLTSDSPAFENPMEIMHEVESGFKDGYKNYALKEDRSEAVEFAVSMAESGDIIALLGKGEEDYQEINGIKYPYSDKEAISKALETRKNKKLEEAI